MEIREIVEKVAAAVRANKPVIACTTCDSVWDPEEAGPLRECSSEACGAVFVSDDRTCPDCNRPFTRRLADHGCRDCGEECEVIG